VEQRLGMKEDIVTVSTTTTAAATVLWPPGLCPGLPDEPVPER